MIRILQISDIHFLSCEEEDDNYSQLRQCLLDDIDDLVGERGAINIILVCGDIANKGQKEEYDKAREFFKDLAQHSMCCLDDVYLVPGNHDVNWGNHSKSRDVLRKELFDEKNNDALLSSWREKEPIALTLAHAPFEEYREMALIFNSNDDISNAIIDGEQDLSKRKFYWKKCIGTEAGYNVFVYGMSTALISGDGDYVPEKGTGQKMFLPKCSYSIVRHKDEINISMMHHPMTHVMRGSTIERSLDARFQIQLYGHTHKQSSNDNSVIKIYSGALQPDEIEGEEYVPIYNLLELYVEEKDEEKNVVVDLYSRQGNDEGFVAYKEKKRTLFAPLKHDNQWVEDDTLPVEKELDSKGNDTIAIKMSRTINEINYTFMNMGSVKAIIQKLYPGSYEVRLSDRTNRLRFLQRVKKDNRYGELDKLITR